MHNFTSITKTDKNIWTCNFLLSLHRSPLPACLKSWYNATAFFSLKLKVNTVSLPNITYQSLSISLWNINIVLSDFQHSNILIQPTCTTQWYIKREGKRCNFNWNVISIEIVTWQNKFFCLNQNILFYGTHFQQTYSSSRTSFCLARANGLFCNSMILVCNAMECWSNLATFSFYKISSLIQYFDIPLQKGDREILG